LSFEYDCLRAVLNRVTWQAEERIFGNVVESVYYYVVYADYYLGNVDVDSYLPWQKNRIVPVEMPAVVRDDGDNLVDRMLDTFVYDSYIIWNDDDDGCRLSSNWRWRR